MGDGEESLNIVVAILAAGRSTRMGGNPKLCLPWTCTDLHRKTFGNEKPASVLSHLIAEWHGLRARCIHVIYGTAQDDPVRRELDDLTLALSLSSSEPKTSIGGEPTQYPERDMMGSVQTAANCVVENLSSFPPSTHLHLLIALGDQPHLQPLTLQRIISTVRDQGNARSILRPRRNGRGGHPIAIPRHLIPELASTEAPTLKHFLQLYQADIVDVPCDDPGLVHDIDTPEDYEKARILASATYS